MSTAHPLRRVKSLKHEIPLSRVCSGLRPRPGSPPLLGRGWGWGGSQLYPRGERGRLAARAPPEGPWRAQVTRPRERALRLEPHFAGTRLPWGGLSERRTRAGASPSPCSRTPPRRRASARSRPCAPAPPPRAPPSGCASTDAVSAGPLPSPGGRGNALPGGRGQGAGGARWAGPGRREDRGRAPRRGEMPGTRGRSHRCSDGGRPAPGAHTGARRWPVRTRAEDHREDPRPGIGWAPGWRARRREAR